MMIHRIQKSIHGNQLGLDHKGRLLCPEGLVIGAPGKQQEVFGLRNLPRYNRLIKTQPTLLAKPYNRDGSSTATNITPSGVGAAIAVDLNRTDVATGLPMAKITVPASNTSYQTIDYFDMEGAIQFEPDDVYLVSVFLPSFVPANLVIQILVSDKSSVSGSDYRTYTWQTSHGVLQRGHNVLHVLQSEVHVNSSTHGTVGTTTNTPWINTGDQVETSATRSIRMRVRFTTGPAGEENIWFGGIYRAPAGWAKGVVCWSADDVPKSFYDYAIPVIESFGWRSTLNIVSAYAADTGGSYMSTDMVKECMSNGHEIWGHTRLHDNLDTSTLDEKTTSLKAARDFFNAHGIHTAAQFMAYPFGAYDDETLALLPTLGYKLASATTGQFNSVLTPAVNPYYISRNTTERQNSWQVDTMLNGCIKRGQMFASYMHNAVPGGARSNEYPGAVSFYVEHLRRWCELVKEQELRGNVEVLTMTEFYLMCGVNPATDPFASAEL